MGVSVGLSGAGVPQYGAGVTGACDTGRLVGGLVTGDILGWGSVGLWVGRFGQGSSSILP